MLLTSWIMCLCLSFPSHPLSSLFRLQAFQQRDTLLLCEHTTPSTIKPRSHLEPLALPEYKYRVIGDQAESVTMNNTLKAKFKAVLGSSLRFCPFIKHYLSLSSPLAWNLELSLAGLFVCMAPSGVSAQLFLPLQTLRLSPRSCKLIHAGKPLHSSLTLAGLPMTIRVHLCRAGLWSPELQMHAGVCLHGSACKGRPVCVDILCG